MIISDELPILSQASVNYVLFVYQKLAADGRLIEALFGRG